MYLKKNFSLKLKYFKYWWKMLEMRWKQCAVEWKESALVGSENNKSGCIETTTACIFWCIVYVGGAMKNKYPSKGLLFRAELILLNSFQVPLFPSPFYSFHIINFQTQWTVSGAYSSQILILFGFGKEINSLKKHPILVKKMNAILFDHELFAETKLHGAKNSNRSNSFPSRKLRKRFRQCRKPTFSSISNSILKYMCVCRSLHLPRLLYNLYQIEVSPSVCLSFSLHHLATMS